MLCLYHIADHDGKGSAAIVKNLYPETKCVGFNYDMEIPYDELAKHQKIVICDVSLPMEYMFELNEKADLTWIDHHVSAINKYNEELEKGNHREIKGIRKIGTAAIMLTWQYFHPEEEAPEAIKLLGLNDIFDLRDKRVRPFEYAVQALGVNRPEDKVWKKLLDKNLNINELVENGNAILNWIKIRNFRLSRGLSFETEIDGMRCICANMARGYSEFFDSLDNIDKYDVMINFYMNKNHTWNLSFYSAKENVDVSKLAAKFGGGGHAGAAGASALKELPEFLQKGIAWRSDL